MDNNINNNINEYIQKIIKICIKSKKRIMIRLDDIHNPYSFVSNILLSESQLFINGTNISKIFNESTIEYIYL